MEITKEHLLQVYESASSHNKHFDKAQTLVTVIEIKQNTPAIANCKRSLYLDTMDMLNHYVLSRNGKDYGYDQLDNEFIISYIEKEYFSPRQQLSLYKKIETQLQHQGEDTSWIPKRTLNQKLKIFKKENKFKYILVYSGKNKKSCIITLLILFAIECIFLLPLADDANALFSVKQSHFSDCEILNYITNVWALRLDWIDGPELTCLSPWGIVLVTLWLGVYIVFVANIIFKNLFDDIDIYEISE